MNLNQDNFRYGHSQHANGDPLLAPTITSGLSLQRIARA
jgi:hypothetical protein